MIDWEKDDEVKAREMLTVALSIAFTTGLWVLVGVAIGYWIWG